MTRSFAFIWQFIYREKVWFFFGLLMTGMVSGLSWFGPKVIARIIDEGIVPQNQQRILYGVGILAATELTRLFSVFLSQAVYAILGQNVIERVRKRMIHHLMGLPVSFFDGVTSGGMMTKVVNDVNSLTDFFQSGFVSILGNFASIVAIFVGLCTLNLKLGLILFIAFIPSIIACFYFSNVLKGVYEHTRNQLAFLNSILADFLFGMKTIRSLGLSHLKLQKLNRQIQKYAQAQMKMVRTFALFHPSYTLGTGVMMLLLVILGIPMVEQDTLKIGQWVAALSYIVALQGPLTEISDRWNFFLAGVTSIERIIEVMDEVPEQTVPSSGRGEAALPPESIEFAGASYRYPGSPRGALSGVSCAIRKGDWIGVYGESGSGKSTFLQMIYGFYPPSEGELRWNGRTYSSVDLRSIRSHFGVVEQFPFLFTGTILENLSLFHPEGVDLEALRREFAGYALIESLLAMPGHEMTERGGNLSMGQKQMIAFLRAYISRPRVWILDEATAFFDPEAESEVMRALERLGPDVIVIQVAHRPEALVRMKRRFRVDQGMLEEVVPL
jgi:ATP-binding cassette subfamily B multidrug efflux pump